MTLLGLPTTAPVGESGQDDDDDNNNNEITNVNSQEAQVKLTQPLSSSRESKSPTTQEAQNHPSARPNAHYDGDSKGDNDRYGDHEDEGSNYDDYSSSHHQTNKRMKSRERPIQSKKRSRYDEEDYDEEETFWVPLHDANHSQINRTVFAWGKPRSMAVRQFKEFLNKKMQKFKLCPPNMFPIVECRLVRGRPSLCALLLRNGDLASQALHLTGIPLNKSNLKITWHTKANRKSEDGTKHGKEIGKRAKSIFVGNLPANVSQPNLLDFLEKNMRDCELLGSSKKPLFESCDIRLAPDRKKSRAILCVRSVREGLNILNLNDIPYMGQSLLISITGWSDSPYQGNWFEFQRELRQKRARRQQPNEMCASNEASLSSRAVARSSTIQDNKGNSGNENEHGRDKRLKTSSEEPLANHQIQEHERLQRQQQDQGLIYEWERKYNKIQEAQQQDQKLIEESERKYSKIQEEHGDLRRANLQSQQLVQEWEQKYNTILKEHKDLKKAHLQSQQLIDEWKSKYDKLLEEYTDMGKDYRRMSQSLADASEQERHVIQEEKDRRHKAECSVAQERKRRHQAEQDLQTERLECDQQVQDARAELQRQEQLFQQERLEFRDALQQQEQEQKKEIRKLQEELIKQHRLHRHQAAAASPHIAPVPQIHQQQLQHHQVVKHPTTPKVLLTPIKREDWDV